MPLTSEQFNLLATKDDLKKYATKEELNHEFNLILTALATVMHKLDIIQDKLVANIGAHDRFEDRISNVENHLNLNPCIAIPRTSMPQKK